MKFEKPIKVDIEQLARAYYFRHKNLDSHLYDYMWEQCSPEYQQAWMTIAKAELEAVLND